MGLDGILHAIVCPVVYAKAHVIRNTSHGLSHGVSSGYYHGAYDPVVYPYAHQRETSATGPRGTPWRTRNPAPIVVTLTSEYAAG